LYDVNNFKLERFFKKEKEKVKNSYTNPQSRKNRSTTRRSRDGEMEIAAYLAEAAGPFQLVLDLRIAHD